MSHGPVAARAGAALLAAMAPAASVAAAPRSSAAFLACLSRDRKVIVEPALSHPRVHCWLDWPLHVHSSTRAPLAVLALVTSRHRPDCVPVMVPLELTAHRWFAPPLQVQISTLVPGVVWLLKASRHFWLLPL